MGGNHYIGIDVGTGSARACVVDQDGTILALADEAIKTWQPKPEYYEQSTQNIWRAVCNCVRTAIKKANLTADSVRGIGFDATCSLAVLHRKTGQPVSVTPGSSIGSLGDDSSSSTETDTPNVVLWLDHRPVEETAKINATGHAVLKYVGGSMNVEMEIPKVLWLKNHLTPEQFAECSFFDLGDALTHLATSGPASANTAGSPEKPSSRSLNSVVCKQGYIPVGIDGSVKGWQPDFLAQIGLPELESTDFAPLGGVDGNEGNFLTAGDFTGYLSASAAEQMGLHTGVAVGTGVIDAYAGWIGTAGASVEPSKNIGVELATEGKILTDAVRVDDPATAIAASAAPATVFSRLAAVAGTSTCHLAMSADAVFVPGVWGPYRDVVFPGRWLTEGGQSATGELLRTLIDSHAAGPEARRLATSNGKSVYAFLNDRIRHLTHVDIAHPVGKAAVPSADSPVNLTPLLRLVKHTFLYPDFFGNRSPLADPHMRGAIVGLGGDQTSIDALAIRYLAGLEAIALQTAQIVGRMNSSGHAIQSIFLSGSLGLNEILNRLIATACGMPVLLPTYPAAAVVQGAAMLGARAAATASGVPSSSSIRNKVAKVADVVKSAVHRSTADGGDGQAESDPASLWAIMQRMSKPATPVWPDRDPTAAALLKTKLAIFEDMADKQREWRGRVDATLKQ